MRVLVVNHLLDPITGGGTAERTTQLCRMFARAGVECTVLALDIGITAERRAELAQVRTWLLPCILHRFFIPRFSWREMRNEVLAADVVYLVGHWTLLNALVFLAARGAGRPYVFSPAGALPIIGRSALLKRLYNLLIGRRIVGGAARHIAITRGEIEGFLEYGVDPAEIVIIPNGAPAADLGAHDCDRFLDRHGLTTHRYVLFLGRLAYIKGPDLLLEAFAEVAHTLGDLNLVFAGTDGGMLSALMAGAERMGLAKRVHFIGYVGGGDKVCALQNCALLAIPSRREAMSLVALEAAAYARPVLLTDQCGFSEVAQVGGGRVTPANAAAIGSALVQMLANPAELSAMGARLQAFVEQEYTWSAATEKHLALFRQIVMPAR
jgi:glycosyltransferase involved in cell wall biosynthesis